MRLLPKKTRAGKDKQTNGVVLTREGFNVRTSLLGCGWTKVGQRADCLDEHHDLSQKLLGTLGRRPNESRRRAAEESKIDALDPVLHGLAAHRVLDGAGRVVRLMRARRRKRVSL